MSDMLNTSWMLKWVSSMQRSARGKGLSRSSRTRARPTPPYHRHSLSLLLHTAPRALSPNSTSHYHQVSPPPLLDRCRLRSQRRGSVNRCSCKSRCEGSRRSGGIRSCKCARCSRIRALPTLPLAALATRRLHPTSFRRRDGSPWREFGSTQM